MEWYLNWLDKNERFAHEEKPMGIILCVGKDHDDIEYLEMDKTGIHVAQYLTEISPKKFWNPIYVRPLQLRKKRI